MNKKKIKDKLIPKKLVKIPNKRIITNNSYTIKIIVSQEGKSKYIEITQKEYENLLSQSEFLSSEVFRMIMELC